MAKAQDYIWGGGTLHRNKIPREGGHSTYFHKGNNGSRGKTGRGNTAHILLLGGTIEVGTPHSIEKMAEASK